MTDEFFEKILDGDERSEAVRFDRQNFEKILDGDERSEA